MDESDGVPEDDFPATENTPGQAESRAARGLLERWLTEQADKPPAWLALWEELREERAPMVGPDGEPRLNERGEVRTRRRWDWRKALYIAWSSLPRSQRKPESLEKLCDLLGLHSAGTIRNWRRMDPEIDERIARLPRRMLLGHVADVYAALVDVATLADPKAFQDRRLFLELVGEYDPKGTVFLSGPENGPVPVDLSHGLANLDDDELDALARIAGRFAEHQAGAGEATAD
jgi:hypothetical protein